jgi:outer membrane receptor protein involved in Fe transport
MSVFKTGSKIQVLLLAIVFVLGSCGVVQAQSTANLQGTVTDAQGASVEGATVVVRNLATNIERKAQSDSNGAFEVSALPAGNYRIEIKKDGFQTFVVESFSLEVGTTVAKTYQLKVGSVTETTRVVADAPVIDAATTSVGQVISSKVVQEIPLNGRHFVDLALLIPGTVTPPANGFLTAPLRGQGSFSFNTAGNREDAVNFMVNGINLNDMVQNQVTFQPSINTVSEFKVDNSTYGAEYGKSSGAIVNIATRSGSNQFHGEAFEFLRNNVFDARNFFNKALSSSGKPLAQSPFKRNSFGGSLGGPIVKDKTFFFGSYEGLRQRQGITTNAPVLSDANFPRPSPIPGNPPDATERIRALASTSPAVQALTNLIPAPNSADGNGNPVFLGSAVAPVNIDQWTADISHNFTDSDQLHGYYVFQRDLRQEPTLQGNNLPGFGDTRQSHRQIFTLNETHVFSPTVVNQVRLGFNRIHITFANNSTVDQSTFGIGTGVNTPIGLPQIQIGGLNFGGSTNGFPQGRGDTTAVLSDTLSWSRGRHSLKFGGELRRFYNNNFQQFVGFFNFANVAAFIADNSNQFTFTRGKGASQIEESALGFFVQDSFRWKPNFTLELGLRYDWNMSPNEKTNRYFTFDPGTTSMVQVNTPYHQNNKNFGPRVGFAWDPFNDGKTSVRAAYAIQYDQPITGYVLGLTTNPPNAIPVNFTTGVTLENPIPPGNVAVAPAMIDPNFNDAYVQSYNLNVQREIAPSLGIMVGYFGSKGTHLNIVQNFNQRVAGLRPFPTVSIPGQTGTSGLNNINEQTSNGNSNYNALWVTVTKRVSHGLQFNASYTFSKSIDYNSLNAQGVVVQDSTNIRNDRGLSDFDARHRIVLNWIYQLPFKGNRLVEGWQVSAITMWQTGNPLNIITNDSTLTGSGSLRPDRLTTVTVLGDPAKWFSNIVCDPGSAGFVACPSGATFSIPRTGTTAATYHFGNLGRNAVTGPGFSNNDFSVMKTTRITEAVRIQFRAELFDIFNHPNFGNPSLVATSSTFGVITSTRFPGGDFGSSRQAQFSLKLLF